MVIKEICQLGGYNGIISFVDSCYAGKTRQPVSRMTCTNCKPFSITFNHSE